MNLLMQVLATYSLCLLYTSCQRAFPLELTQGPVSVSVLGGENTLFHCNSSGAAVQWVADEVHVTDTCTDPVIVDRGITASVAESSGTVQSTLTVPATLVNNGTTVQCVIYPGEVTSNTATLTVLPGEQYRPATNH